MPVQYSREREPDAATTSADRAAEQNFCVFYASMLKQYPPEPDTTRLFERAGGQYYTAHGDDALFIADTVYKTSTVLKYWGQDSLPYCWISRLNALELMRNLLLVDQKRVEIWEPDGSRKNSFILSKKGSPGNLHELEELIFENSGASASMFTAPVVLVARPTSSGTDGKNVGVAFTDATTMHRIGVSEFVDNDSFSNFESLLIQLSVKECVIPDDNAAFEVRKVQQILERCNIVVTKAKKSFFDTKDVEQDLRRLLESDTPVGTLPEFDLKSSMASVACLIKYLNLMGDDSNFGQYTLESYDLKQYMRLDASAVQALNLMPSAIDGANRNMSLYSLLNKCKTPQGGRLLAQWLKQPLMNITDIQLRHNLVESFQSDSEMRQTLQEDILKKFPDLHRIGKKFLRGSAGLQDVVRLYQVVITLPKLLEVLQSHDREYRWLITEMYSTPLKEYASGLSKFQEMVEATVDLEAAENHEYMIKADFDPELQEMLDERKRIEKKLQPEAERVADDLDVELEKKLKLEFTPVHGWHLRLMKTDQAKIRGKSDYIELSTQKAGILFVTAKLRHLSESIEELRSKYESKQGDVVKEIISTAASYYPVLERLNQLLAHIDCIVSFAHVCVHSTMPFVRPKMKERGSSDLILKASRHPCVEVQDGVSFIANEVQMLRESSSFQIITGPNMGGKSTYIRQVGVAVLMAQVGCFVPCEEATIPVFDSIMCRVGAGDSQLKGVSTFMAEMLETASILRSATSDSLIIIDELGRGTSTYDGFGLAWAISEHIAKNINCFALFATHFHELTALSEQIPTVKNLHVTARADAKSMTLLYKVTEGVCDQSFGIHVAELAAFPESVIRLAKRKASELEDFSAASGPDDSQNLDSAMEVEKRYSKEEMQAGDQVIRQFLAEFKELASKVPRDASNEEDPEWLAGVRSVLEDVKSRWRGEVENSAYLREIVEQLG